MPSNILSPVGPSPIEVTNGDVLIINDTSAAGVGGASTRPELITWRIKCLDGIIRSYSQSITTIMTGGETINVIPLVPGWLLGVGYTPTTAAGQTGQVYAQVYFGKPSLSGGVVLDTLLMAGCPPGFQTISWPAQTKLNTDGPGVLARFTVSNPASATNFTTTLTFGLRVQHINWRFRLVTSATAGNRQVGLRFTDASSNIYFDTFAQVSQPASETVDYNFSAGVGPNFVGAATLIAVPTPDNVQCAMPNGLFSNDATVVASVVTGITTGDQISAIVGYVNVWNEIN